MPLTRYLKTSSTIVSLTLFSSLALPVHAQQADDEGTDTIYVTGSFY